MVQGDYNEKRKYTRLSQGLLPIFYKGTCARLASLHQTSSPRNQREALLHNTRLFLAGFLYFAFCSLFFNEFWYHLLICLASTLLFTYILDQKYFEKKRALITNALPVMLNKLAHYYSHLEGNLIAALEAAEKQSPSILKAYYEKIKEALQAENREQEIKLLQEKLPFSWLKVLCGLLLTISKEGYAVQKDKTNGVSDILRKMSSALYSLNIQQGYSNAEFIHYESFLLIAPFIILPGTKLFNSALLKYIDMPDVYGSVRGQTIAALIFLLSNLSVLFVYWIRKAES